MKVELTKITPDLAKLLLEKNTKNRRLSKSRVAFYANEILSGRWILNGETIKVSADGTLLDGQHRLHAILKANKPIDGLLITGIESELAIDTIDTGKARIAADVLDILQVPNSRSIAGGINKYLLLSRGLSNTMVSSSDSKTSNSEIKDEYFANDVLYQNLHRLGVQFYNSNFRILKTSDYIGFYRLFQIKHSNSIIDSFFDSISSRTGAGAVLYDRLMKNTISKKETLTHSEKNAIIIKAFNAHVSGKVVKVLKYSIEESFPKVA